MMGVLKSFMFASWYFRSDLNIGKFSVKIKLPLNFLSNYWSFFFYQKSIKLLQSSLNQLRLTKAVLTGSLKWSEANFRVVITSSHCLLTFERCIHNYDESLPENRSCISWACTCQEFSVLLSSCSLLVRCDADLNLLTSDSLIKAFMSNLTRL